MKLDLQVPRFPPLDHTAELIRILDDRVKEEGEAVRQLSKAVSEYVSEESNAKRVWERAKLKREMVQKSLAEASERERLLRQIRGRLKHGKEPKE